MKHTRKANRIASLVVAICAVCAMMVIPAFASESDLSEGLINGAYPVAPNGMTYGTMAQREITGTWPDLVAVSPSEDIHGYVKLEDLSPVRYMTQLGASTEEINAYIESIGGNEGPRVIPMYDLDMNVIGEFSTGSEEPIISGSTPEEIQSALADGLVGGGEPTPEIGEKSTGITAEGEVRPGFRSPTGSIGEFSAGGQKNPFTDVSESSPFYDAILWAVEKNITNGTTSTTFSPNSTCSVSNILTFLWRANGKPGTVEGTADRDSAYKWAVEQRLIQQGTDVNSPCTRAMAVTFMWKNAGSPGTETTVIFSDVSTRADYLSAVAWAVKQGITTGTSATTFSPDTACTRGQIATFLYRGLAG